ncbi:ADP-ribosylglycohydrolase family protein [Aeromonas sp. 602396]|uniref:ADP-ribosylglycohydrolase family protein n=1 Tax=Aeromonas sp. 602396 TaxID=2712042 RepID=UPI003B9E06F3
MNSLREKKVINSALWAAAGDAIGWISELTDENGLKRRIGTNHLLKPVSWQRKIGGYSGVTVNLPAGTYSDDTQLRLAVSRSIRSNGEFDAESFAKIELPVWLSYALGAGRATKLAATNLMRKDTNWFSNFYKNNSSEYTQSGGNGTAMRIQPHVWCSRQLSERLYIPSVIKDSLTTHGHLLSVCGAILHADALQYSLLNDKPASPVELDKFIDKFLLIPDIINSIYELKNFWLPNWEDISETELTIEIKRIHAESKALLSNALESASIYIDPIEKYKSAIATLECDKDSRRGTATNTVIASSLLCYFFKNSTPYEAITACVNHLGTDTDSIASMAGAILGCYSDMPQWDIQDSKYIINEAKRLNSIAEGGETINFNYPNINKWLPPQTQGESLVKDNDGIYHIVGLGKIDFLNTEAWKTKTHSWQWVQFDFGQSILVKNKLGEAKVAETYLLRDNKQSHLKITPLPIQKNNQTPYLPKQESFDYNYTPTHELDIDVITTNVIKNGFNEQEIGRYFIELADKKGLESIISFAAIIGKAFISRKKR